MHNNTFLSFSSLCIILVYYLKAHFKGMLNKNERQKILIFIARNSQSNVRYLDDEELVSEYESMKLQIFGRTH